MQDAYPLHRTDNEHKSRVMKLLGFWLQTVKNILKKNFLLKTLGLVICLAAIGYVAVGFYRQSIPNPMPQPGLDAKQMSSQTPVHLTIPSISVDAPIQSVGLASDGSVGVPKGPNEVAWYKLGPRPGEKGSAVITGHYGPWRNGAGSVFDNLYKLKKGDKIYVKDDKGATIAFVVKETRIYNLTDSAPEIFSKNDGKQHLNLITCNGDWLKDKKTYTKRLVIFTDAA